MPFQKREKGSVSRNISFFWIVCQRIYIFLSQISHFPAPFQSPKRSSTAVTPDFRHKKRRSAFSLRPAHPLLFFPLFLLWFHLRRKNIMGISRGHSPLGDKRKKRSPPPRTGLWIWRDVKFPESFSEYSKEDLSRTLYKLVVRNGLLPRLLGR